MEEYQSPSGEWLSERQTMKAMSMLADALERQGRKSDADSIRDNWRKVANRPVLWWILQQAATPSRVVLFSDRMH